MFSVVIPVYNHRRYLAQCVLSAARSPLVEEVLLLDDGSSDGSPALVKQLAGGALAKVRDVTPEGRGNRGAHATLNELCAQARSGWIAVLNSDDHFTPSRFDLIRRRMRFQQFDLCFGNVLVIDAQGTQLGGKRAMFDPQLPFPANFDVARMAAGADWLPLLAQQNFLATTSNMVFRKTLFERLEGFRDLRYVHDWDFCLRASLEATVAYVPHALTAYRVHAANTIKEDSERVDREVAALFERLLAEYPALKSNEAFSEGLAANPYLQHRSRPTLTVDCAGYRPQGIRTGENGLYTYSPVSERDALSPIHLQNAVLALEMQLLDCVVVSHTLSDPPAVGFTSLRNAAVFRTGIASPATGRIARLLPGGGSIYDLNRLLPPLAQPAARAEPLPTGLLSPPDSTRPLIFVLPALFAVGGVERLVIDMMRQLADRYRFVVITVERLQSGQGSLHGAAEGSTLGFYDLAELAPPELFLPMMERLRDVYGPALVWVPNGSPWQCDHAAHIRRVFRDIPIVDQQVYDTEAGWISRYHEPGIRSYDRFIAINRRIEESFIRKYGIPADRIDMIYHSVNLAALGPRQRTAEQLREYRRAYGLPESGPIFGWVGRFTAQKRPLEFLDFARGAAQHFVMIGDGELSAECDRFIEEHSIRNVTRVRFSSRMGELFATMSGLLCASEYEGLPISMLEALAMGVPVYSTDVGDVKLVLEEYGSGQVTGPKWDADRYRTGFEAWLENLGKYRENAESAAPQVRERFGSAAVADAYERCFQSAWKQREQCYTGESESTAILL